MSTTVHHLSVSAEDLASEQPGGRLFFLPGSRSRAELIAGYFQDVRCHPASRGHDVFTGVLSFDGLRVEAGVVSTGMGCPSAGIVVSELLSLGVKRYLRIGTAGSLQPSFVTPGDIIVATAAVRDEAASLAYAPIEVPAVGSFEFIACLMTAAGTLGLSKHVHAGLVHTKDSLYGREFKRGPMRLENERYMQILGALGVLASEMEASHLFLLAQCSNGAVSNQSLDRVLSGCVLAIIGGDEPFASDEIAELAIDRAIKLSFEGVRHLYRRGQAAEG